MDEMISIEKFDGSDFGFWKMRIEDYLYSRDLYLPLEEKPEKMDSEEWRILDRKAMSAIRLSLSRNVAYNTMKAKSAREMLAILEHMYQRPSTANKVHLMRQLSNLKMLEGTSVHQHLNEFNMIISQLSSIEIDFDDEVRALIMLSSLPESWARIVTTVSASSAKSKLCFDEVRDLMISEELRRKESGSSSGSAMNTEERVSKSRGESQSQLSLEERFNLIRSIGEECIQEDELERLLANKSQIICYDGFEPSGRMHIAQGVMKAINVNKLTSAGCIVKIWIADWFAKMNHKMGGDMDKIKVIGEYMIEIWKALGMNTGGGQVEFLWASKEIAAGADEYIFRVLDIATRNNLSRILRCSQIMGRSDKDELSAAQIFYPCMQCADIFFLKADICQLGMDQRKVNMLAREYCDQIGRKHKPVIVSHHMLPGLLEGQEKMSKSDPSSSIFMEDEEADVNLKIKKAFCPPKVVEKNPCLEYIKYIVFPWFGEFMVERKPENGGHKNFISFDELVIDYESGDLHPGDLKPALAKALNRILQPVRDHFKNDDKAKKLLKSVKSYKVTR